MGFATIVFERDGAVSTMRLNRPERMNAVIEMMYREIQRAVAQDLETVLNLEAEAILELMDTEDWREGVDAFSAGRRPVFRGR